MLYRLKAQDGIEAVFSDYGARWVSMSVPDRYGKFEDVVLGFDSEEDYKNAKEQYYGAIVGRVCGRIAGASFELDGRLYRLASNDVYGIPVHNHLHGGRHALHNRFWQGRKNISEEGDEQVIFTALSPDGEEGYPGNLELQVVYTIEKGGWLDILCTARTDAPTPVNLTNHAFFNLSGKSPDILGHKLFIGSDRLIECDSQLLPTGRLLELEGMSLDFSGTKTVRDALDTDYCGTRAQGGFSMAYALHGNVPCAELHCPENGRTLSIFTNQPSIQVYTGYFFDGSDKGKSGAAHNRSAGIALEPQGFPDAVHHREFPSIILRPGEEYVHHSRYHFTAE